MTREIKFRAWDTKEKKMLVDSVGEKPYSSDDKYIKITGSEVLYYDAPDMSYYGGGEWSEKGGEYSFMQYTGLKDRNGREIYEGDVIRNDNDEFRDYSVKWSEKIGSWVLSGHNCGDSYNDILTKFSPKEFWEVIGNVHENPSLLKP